MTPHQNLDVLLLLLAEVIHYVSGDASYCPRSLYDCNSLQSGMHSYSDIIITPEFMTSAHDDNYIWEICKFFKRQECSDPILDQCKGEIVYATRAFRSRQQYICGDRFPRKGMRSLNTCVQKYRRHFSTCHQKHQSLLEEATYVTQTTTITSPWCNLTKDYITCVYSVMALGCTLEVAEKYMEIVNQSMPVLEAIFRYGCAFGHPLDILKTTSPPPDTSTSVYNNHEILFSSARRPSSGSGRSNAVTNHHHESSSFLQIVRFSVFHVACSYAVDVMYEINFRNMLWSLR